MIAIQRVYHFNRKCCRVHINVAALRLFLARNQRLLRDNP